MNLLIIKFVDFVLLETFLFEAYATKIDTIFSSYNFISIKIVHLKYAFFFFCYNFFKNFFKALGKEIQFFLIYFWEEMA